MPRKPAWTNLMPLTAVLVLFLWTSIYGLNFGVHWDETRAKFDSVRDSVNTGIFLQAAGDPEGKNYNYGGVNYLLTWGGFTPELWRFVRHGVWSRDALSAQVTPVIYSLTARLRVRMIYLLLSALSIVWIFWLARLLDRSRLEAFWAAAVLAGSWEVAYHSRWIAPDVVMMQFGLLAFLCLAAGMVKERLFWFYAGAIATGLAIGTKYPAGLILPFFLIGFARTLWQIRNSPAFVLKHLAAATALSGVIFIVTTPGVVLDPFRFFSQLREQQEIYGSGWYGYTVQPGFAHLFAMAKYFALQLFSHYWLVSLIFTGLCVLGLISLIVERRLFVLLMAGFAAAYLLFFSRQAAMIVRNLLVVVPFLSLAAARGITVAAQQLRNGRDKLVYALVGLLLSVNFGWEAFAAYSIKKRGHFEYFARDFVAYVQDSPAITVLISQGLAETLKSISPVLPGNIVTAPDKPHSEVAFLQSEGADKKWSDWPSNWWGMYKRTFGPLEVNLDAYSTFVGNERILVTTSDHFRRLPITEAELTSAASTSAIK